MKSSCLLTMLDGHCGRKAADEVAQELPRDLGKRLMRHRHSLAAGQGAGSAWSEAFLATDASIKAEEGCTATALLIWVDEEGQACMQASISRTSLNLMPACLQAAGNATGKRLKRIVFKLSVRPVAAAAPQERSEHVGHKCRCLRVGSMLSFWLHAGGQCGRLSSSVCATPSEEEAWTASAGPDRGPPPHQSL